MEIERAVLLSLCHKLQARRNGKVLVSKQLELSCPHMITVETDDISERQLAEIALAIQNRWEVPAFVKMHEIVIVEEDGNTPEQKIPPLNFERGIGTIFENLEMRYSFRLTRTGKTKYRITRIAGSTLPRWMKDIETPVSPPEGVFVCAHCGKWFQTDIERSLHTKLHYII